MKKSIRKINLIFRQQELCNSYRESESIRTMRMFRWLTGRCTVLEVEEEAAELWKEQTKEEEARKGEKRRE